VNRVDNLPEGLYVLVRDVNELENMKLHLRLSSVDYHWVSPNGIPSHLKPYLFLLFRQNLNSIAGQISCNQDIAGDGAFSAGMIAKFEPINRIGPSIYRRLYWEAGVIGQVLYLEAEAHGIKGTGIGCYFDEAVHTSFGVDTSVYQSLYHFTVGGPLEDRRLRTLSAYGAMESGKFSE